MTDLETVLAQISAKGAVADDERRQLATAVRESHAAWLREGGPTLAERSRAAVNAHAAAGGTREDVVVLLGEATSEVEAEMTKAGRTLASSMDETRAALVGALNLGPLAEAVRAMAPAIDDLRAALADFILQAKRAGLLRRCVPTDGRLLRTRRLRKKAGEDVAPHPRRGPGTNTNGGAR